MKTKIILIFLIILCFNTEIFSKRRDKEFYDKTRNAYRLQRTGKINEAVRIYIALAKEYDDFETYNKIVQIYAGNNEFSKAEELIENWKEKSSDKTMPNIALLNIYFYNNKDKAYDLLDKLIKENKRNTSFYFRVFNILKDHSEYEKAIDIIHQARKSFKNETFMNNQYYQILKDMQDYETLFFHYVESGKDSDFLFLFANQYNLLQSEDFISQLQTIINTNTKYREVITIANIFLRINDLQTAKDLFTSLQKRFPKEDPINLFLTHCYGQNEFDLIVETANEKILNNISEDTFIILSETYFKTNHLTELDSLINKDNYNSDNMKLNNKIKFDLLLLKLNITKENKDFNYKSKLNKIIQSLKHLDKHLIIDIIETAALIGYDDISVSDHSINTEKIKANPDIAAALFEYYIAVDNKEEALEILSISGIKQENLIDRFLLTFITDSKDSLSLPLYIKTKIKLNKFPVSESFLYKLETEASNLSQSSFFPLIQLSINRKWESIDFDTASSRYDTFIKSYPNHFLTPEALYYFIDLNRQKNNITKVEELEVELLSRFPNSIWSYKYREKNNL